MRLHREGRRMLIYAAIGLILVFFILNMLSLAAFLIIILLIPFLIIYFLISWFFRVPLRLFKRDDNLVYAPADGKIVVIEETMENEYFHDKRMQVSIFMSPLNVHQNTYPVGGKVVYTKYHKGAYMVAWHPKSSTENERSTVVIEMDNGEQVLVRQIAGAVARRICTYAMDGQNVKQGEELGFIKFGSRVDLFLPLHAKIVCSINQKSRNNITPIAELI